MSGDERTSPGPGLARLTAPTVGLVVLGHVNHGKTALVGALTGMETDRLPEEKARGLSIVLGFAWRAYEHVVVDFIDAPGHADFLKTAAAGLSGAEAVLLVVSAREGVQSQTLEHLHLASLRGVRGTIVALSQVDQVPASIPEEAVSALRGVLCQRGLEEVPIIPCSVRTGQGLDQLHGEIAGLRPQQAEEVGTGPRLSIDRAFLASGAGVIVTGCVRGGRLHVGDTLRLDPAGEAVVLRRLEVHGHPVGAALPGQRVAAAIRGPGLADVRPGMMLRSPAEPPAGPWLDTVLTLSDETGHSGLKHMEKVRILHGTGADVARARILNGRSLEAGATGLARLEFLSPVPAWPGRSLLIRRLSPAATLGVARVLDPSPPPIRRAVQRAGTLQALLGGDLAALGEALAQEQGGRLHASEIQRLTGATEIKVRAALDDAFIERPPGAFVSLKSVDQVSEALLSGIEAFHAASPLRIWAPHSALRKGLPHGIAPQVADLALERMLATGLLRGSREGVALAGHDPFKRLTRSQALRLEALGEALRAGGLKPETTSDPLDQEDRTLLELLADAGRALKLYNVSLRQTLFLHPDAITKAVSQLSRAYPSPETFPTGAAREVLGTSRKFIVPLLEHLDALGLTERDGDLRRMARPTGADTGEPRGLNDV